MLTHNEPYDRLLIFAAGALVLLGLLMVASSSIVIAERLFHSPFHYLARQMIYLTVGLALSLVCLRIDTQVWQRLSPLFLGVSILLLIMVLIPGLGHSVNGSSRWLGYGMLRVQASEVAKFAMIIFLAGYCVRRSEELQLTFSGFLKPLAIVLLLSVLLLLEPDFGSAVVITVITFGTLFLAGARLGQFVAMIGLGVVAGGLIAISSPYRIARIMTFLDPWQNQFDSGYQLTQSLIAFGRGGWFGLGLGGSIQKLSYLPEAHTDFLFAVLAEEFGLLGILVVLTLFAILVQRILATARRALYAEHYYGAYLCYGVALLIAAQATINMGVNSGMLPTKGLTLPLMSYGGNSLVVTCVLIALVLRVGAEIEPQTYSRRTVPLTPT